MAADPETLATLNGQPLLGESGMESIHGLLQAHVDYEDAEALHGDEIDELNQQITVLEQRRDGLLSEREKTQMTHHSARHTYTGRVEQAVSDPGKKDNPVYAAVLRSFVSDGQGKLWYPQTLEVADEIGRSFVEFDYALRSSRKSQPALIIERERSGHTNLYLARTKRASGLQPTTVAMEESRGYQRYGVERVALAVPVNEPKITALQVHQNSLDQKESLTDCTYEKGPNLRDNVTDSFKIILPRGLVWSSDVLGCYDSNGLMADVWSGGNELSSTGSIELAIGELSVTKAMERLSDEFAENANHSRDYKPTLNLLSKIALGKAKMPKPSQRQHRPLRVKTNFSTS